MQTADLDALAATAKHLHEAVLEKIPVWNQPREIRSELPPAPPFDGPTLLPRFLADFVLDEADRMPSSPDFVAAALIVSLGAVIGARVAMKPKRRDDWIVTPNLFGGVVGEPSSKKTPAINAALKFLDRLEAREAESFAKRLKQHEAESAAYAAQQAAIQSAMKRAASSKDGAERMADAVADMQELQAPEPPVQRRFKTNDSTVAKLGDILVNNPAGLLVFRDELVGLLASWDREGNEGDRAFYLEGFNGTGSFNIDRIGRGSLFVKNLCLSVFGGIQPELLERYLADMANSLDNDGRFQRFQVLVFPEPVPWEWRDRYPVKGSREAVRDLFDRLATLDPVTIGATPADDFVKLPTLVFDPGAFEIFVEWSCDLHRKRIRDEEDPLMRQHLAKFEKLFCALSLILHLAEGRVGPVQEDTAVRAAAWCQYLEGHARRAYGLVDCGRINAAKTLARRLRDGKLPDSGFTARDVVRKGWSGLNTGPKAEAALSVLVEHDWLVSDEAEEAPGRPTRRYYVNPLIRGGAK